MKNNTVIPDLWDSPLERGGSDKVVVGVCIILKWIPAFAGMTIRTLNI